MTKSLYIKGGYQGKAPTLQEFHAELLRQSEPEARDVALAIELFTEGSLNTFAKPTNVDTDARILCFQHEYGAIEPFHTARISNGTVLRGAFSP